MLCQIRKNASDIYAMLSGAHGGEGMKKSSFFEWHIWFQEDHMSKSQIKSMLITFFDITSNSFHKAKMLAKLIIWKYLSGYVKLCIEKGLNFGLMIGFSTMAMLNLTRHSLSSSS
jgi:hypothetical protein